MSTTKSYYANLKTKSITHEKGGETLNAYAYQYDKNGNTETTSYSFDATDRLTQVVYPNQTVAYTYDKNYNRIKEITTGENPETKSFIYNDRNQLTPNSGDTILIYAIYQVHRSLSTFLRAFLWHLIIFYPFQKKAPKDYYSK